LEFVLQVTSTQLGIKTKRNDSYELSRFFFASAGLKHKTTNGEAREEVKISALKICIKDKM